MYLLVFVCNPPKWVTHWDLYALIGSCSIILWRKTGNMLVNKHGGRSNGSNALFSKVSNANWSWKKKSFYQLRTKFIVMQRYLIRENIFLTNILQWVHPMRGIVENQAPLVLSRPWFWKTKLFKGKWPNYTLHREVFWTYPTKIKSLWMQNNLNLMKPWIPMTSWPRTYLIMARTIVTNSYIWLVKKERWHIYTWKHSIYIVVCHLP